METHTYILRNANAVILPLQETVFGHPHRTDQSTGLKPSLQTETQGKARWGLTNIVLFGFPWCAIPN